MRVEILNWLEQAKRDLKAAENSLKSGDYDWASFQSQQAVEKALKALSIKKTGQFPKIHDLVKLSKLVNAPEEIMIQCGKLNPSYIETRYPDSARDYSKDDAEEFINIADDILKWIEKNL